MFCLPSTGQVIEAAAPPAIYCLTCSTTSWQQAKGCLGCVVHWLNFTLWTFKCAAVANLLMEQFRVVSIVLRESKWAGLY